MPGSRQTSLPPPSSSPTIHQSRCSTPAVVGPRQAGCGSIRGTIGRGPVRSRRRLSISTALIVRLRPASHLGRFKGILQVDGYAGFERLTASGAVVLAACWAHVRRKFYEICQAMASPIAQEALRRIAALYAIEQCIRGRSAEDRRTVRDVESRPLVAAMKAWLEQELGRIPRNGGLAQAIRYALTRWAALSRFLDDGRIELDNNSVERAIRPVAMRRSLYPSCSSIWKHWKLVCRRDATRTTCSPNRGSHPLVLQVGD